MKKVLLGSTALVAVGMMAGAGTPARAAEPISLDLGGFYRSYFIVRTQSDVDVEGPTAAQSTTGNDEDIRHVDVQQDGEVFFVGETTLDNGVKVGVNIQLEAQSTGDQIDEHYVFFQGNFGRLVVGADDAAPITMQYLAPNAASGFGIDSPTAIIFRPPAGNSVGGSPMTTQQSMVSDSNKVIYFTPRFDPGFQFGFSYTPDTSDVAAGGSGAGIVSDVNDQSTRSNAIGASVNFQRNFDNVDFAWSFGYQHGFVEGEGTAPGVACPGGTAPAVCIVDPDNQQGRDMIHLGLNIGFGGWTVGASASWDDEGQERDNDQIGAALGVTYGAGPWLVGAQVGYGRDEDGSTTVNGLKVDFDTDQVVAGELSGTYTLGPGVSVMGVIQAVRGWGDDGNENYDGVGFGLGTRLGF
jgi:predicted porin